VSETTEGGCDTCRDANTLSQSHSYSHTVTQTISRDASFGSIRSCHPPLEAPRLLHGAIWAEMTGGQERLSHTDAGQKQNMNREPSWLFANGEAPKATARGVGLIRRFTRSPTWPDCGRARHWHIKGSRRHNSMGYRAMQQEPPGKAVKAHRRARWKGRSQQGFCRRPAQGAFRLAETGGRRNRNGWECCRTLRSEPGFRPLLLRHPDPRWLQLSPRHGVRVQSPNSFSALLPQL